MLGMMLAGLLMTGAGAEGATGPVRITILYDNIAAVAGTEADWGFSCLVETPSGRVLFDSGTDPAVLDRNLQSLGVELAGIDAVVLSHAHHDHTGGLVTVLEQVPELKVYLPPDSPDEIAGAIADAGGRPIPAAAALEILPGVWTTGRVDGPIAEQALAVITASGPVVITGCAHPGVAALAGRAADAVGSAPSMVVGGFHLLRSDAGEVDRVIGELRELGIEAAAPGHCTGEAAIASFRRAFNDGFRELGVGTVLEFSG